MSLWNSTADTIKCPGCADNLFYEASIGKMICRSCGGVYVPNSLDSSGRLEIRDVDEEDLSLEHQHEIICNSCGAAVVTDENTSAAFCSFCGSPALSIRRLSLEFKPDFIIPFKIDKAEAESIFLDWTKNNRTLPKGFTSKENIEKLTGIYVPFWLIDSSVECKLEASGYETIEGNPAAILFAVDRKIAFKLKRVPFDGAKKIRNALMRSIEPFDYSEMVPFSPNYIPGYYAQRYDTKAIDMLDYVSHRFAKYGGQLGKLYEPTMGTNYSYMKIGSVSAEAGEFKQSYALLPVWFMRYNYKGVNYDIAINGQTGEVGGDLPRKKIYSLFDNYTRGSASYILHYALYVLLITVGLICAFFILGYDADPEAMPLQLIGSSSLVIAITVLISIYEKMLRNKRKELTDKQLGKSDQGEPDALNYYDPEGGITLIDHSDKLIGTVGYERLEEERISRQYGNRSALSVMKNVRRLID